jgi:putative tricarboxylic transport membrane protein
LRRARRGQIAADGKSLVTGINRDTVVAVVLLAVCGLFAWQSTLIRDMGFETIGSEVWPRIVLAVLFVLSSIYLIQSVRQGGGGASGDEPRQRFLSKYRNAFWCYGLFLAFLVSLPWLGMLLGGMLFVFAALTAMGRRTPRSLVAHAAIAILSIGAMWAVFTYGLNVILPAGELLPQF